MTLVSVVATATICATLTFGAATAGAVVRTCGSGSNAYTVTVPSNTPSTGFAQGEDPEEAFAAQCQIGYHEKQAYPLSIVAIMLVVTVATLALLRWKKDDLDMGWTEDDPDLSPERLTATGTAGGAA